MITFSQLGRYGRLGNQMFQIASTIGIAIKNGYDYAFPEWKNYDAAERFGSKEDIDVQKWFKNKLPVLDNERIAKESIGWVMNTHHIPFGFHGFDIPDNVSLSGHMQSEKYFEHCEDVVRGYFEFVDRNALLGEPRSNTTSIHIRLRDYSDQQGYHPVQTKEYYEAAINEIGAKEKFVLYSDDINEAYKLFKEWFVGKYNIRPIYTYIAPISPVMILEMQTGNRNYICSNSTFSWWAAWLSKHPNKKIIQPSNWFGPAWNGTMDAKDIYIKNAIVI